MHTKNRTPIRQVLRRTPQFDNTLEPPNRNADKGHWIASGFKNFLGAKMNLLNLFPQLGWLHLVLLIIGLAVSFSFRARSWVLFIWLPTVGLLSYHAIWIFRKLIAFGHLHGPEAMGAGIVIPILLCLLAVICLGLVLSFFARPRREAWSRYPLLGSIALCAAFIYFSSSRYGTAIVSKYTDVTIELKDAKGTALTNVSIALARYENGLGDGRESCQPDSKGEFSLRLKKGQAAHVQIKTPFPANGSWRGLPTYWTIQLSTVSSRESIVQVRHSWQRSFGGHTFNESYTEFIDGGTSAEIRVVVPAHSGLHVPALDERIKSAVMKFQPKAGAFQDYGYVCANIAAIDLISWLIDKYRVDFDRASIVEGLCRTAAIVDELGQSCREVHRRLLNSQESNGNNINGELVSEATEFCKWAGESQDPLIQGVEKAESKISMSAQLLADFVFSQMSRDDSVVRVLGEMRQTGNPFAERFLQAVQANPPKTGRAAQQWGDVMRRITPGNERLELLAPLFRSEEPTVVLTACEAMSNELWTSANPQILSRLESLQQTPQDPYVSSRIQMHIDVLRKRGSGH